MELYKDKFTAFLVSNVTVLLVFILAFFAFIPSKAYCYTLFGNQEVRSKNLKPFPKWTTMLERYLKEGDVSKQQLDCKSKRFNQCKLKDWQTFLKSIKHKPAKEKLSLVHKYVNEFLYVLDPINWGMPDYWATPKQFFIKDGDCEDYAITKFLSLKALGIPAKDMRVVVLQDLNLNLLHSVLVVYIDNKGWILDNQIPSIVPEKSIHHYRPIYSINEEYWWRYRS